MESFLKNRVLFTRRQSWRRGVIYLLVASFMLTWQIPATSSAAPHAANFPLIHLQLIASDFDRPTNLISAYDGTNRLFVVEQGGLIFILKNGVRQPTPFLDISSLVDTSCPECGLIGLAFPPDFAEKGYFFVNYISKVDLIGPDVGDADNPLIGDRVIARFQLTGNPNVADPDSEERILTVNQPGTNHFGGHILFGPEDYLYMAMGDGGRESSVNAQDPTSLLGKLLRIQVSETAAYTIPADNPFVAVDGYRDEIWAMGLRNPWRFGFDRITDDLYVADVGQLTFEEVNFIAAGDLGNGGMNFGWPILEGNDCYQSGPPCNSAGLTYPVAGYSHDDGRCAITGGSVLRTQDPVQAATYLYGDFCTGIVWGVQRDEGAMASSQLIDLPFGISSFGEDEDGNVYVVDFEGGKIYQILPAENFSYLPGITN